MSDPNPPEVSLASTGKANASVDSSPGFSTLDSESLATLGGPWRYLASVGLWLGLFSCGVFLLAPYFEVRILGGAPEMDQMAGVALLMAIWWLTEAVPPAVAALVPLAAFPLLGVQTSAQVCSQYALPSVYLFLGGFLLALAVEESGLHKRIALKVLTNVGTSPALLSLGFIMTTVLISMWASNTATTLLMMPIAISVMGQFHKEGEDAHYESQWDKLLPLGIAYGASLGGMATPVGTPVNAQFLEYLRTKNEGGASIGGLSFAQWMLIGVPLSLTLSLATWLVLNLLFRDSRAMADVEPDRFRRMLTQLGGVRPAEFRVAVIFLLTALFWVTREPFPQTGWSRWLSNPKAVDDGCVAILMAMVCFLCPSGEAGKALLSPQAFQKVRWDVLLLFGGGMALAKGMEITALDRWLGEKVAAFSQGLPLWALIAVGAAGVTLIGELATNVAAVNMVLPVFHGVAVQLGLPPLVILFSIALASSCGFALPVATPPNAIAYSTGRISMRDMVYAGLCIDILCVVGITIFCGFWAPWVLGR